MGASHTPHNSLLPSCAWAREDSSSFWFRWHGRMGTGDDGNGLLDGEMPHPWHRPGAPPARMASSRPGAQRPYAARHRSGSCISRMDEETTQAKQAGDQSQAPPNCEKAEPKVPKPDEAKKLIQFMENHYDELVARVQSFDEFYHAIFELIEMFCEERGQFQYKILEKETLLEAYNKHHKSDGELKKEEFVAISKEVIGLKSFSFGKAAVELVMFLFGAPVCAVAAKRLLPGLGWLSDDVVIPLATSGSVAYLIRSKRL